MENENKTPLETDNTETEIKLDGDITIKLDENEGPSVIMEGEYESPDDFTNAFLQNPQIREFYETFTKMDVLEPILLYEDKIWESALAKKDTIDSLDEDKVKSMSAKELEEIFLSFFDDLYALIRNVPPFWQVGIERMKLLKDYQDLYRTMIEL